MQVFRYLATDKSNRRSKALQRAFGLLIVFIQRNEHLRRARILRQHHLGDADQADAGIASGLINTTQQIGGAIGVAVATTIATTFTAHYVDSHAGSTAFSGPALTHGFQMAFYVLAALAGAGAVLAAVMLESKPAEPHPETAPGAVELEAAA